MAVHSTLSDHLSFQSISHNEVSWHLPSPHSYPDSSFYLEFVECPFSTRPCKRIQCLATSAAAAAAAKSLQSCPTLCDPTDCSLPGSPVPGILQVRTLEWVAISFSNAWKWKVKVKSLSYARLRDPMDCIPPNSWTNSRPSCMSPVSPSATGLTAISTPIATSLCLFYSTHCILSVEWIFVCLSPLSSQARPYSSRSRDFVSIPVPGTHLDT